MINGLEQIEEHLKHGYRKAVLGFVKSRVTNSTSYFIEITKGALVANVDRIFMTKRDYFYAQELLEKYDELHRIKKEEDKAKKQKSKEDRQKIKDLKIQEIADKSLKEEEFLTEEDDEELPSLEEDSGLGLVLGADTIAVETDEEVKGLENETELCNEDENKGDVNEPNQP